MPPAENDWPDWRGADRAGRAVWLPEKLPAKLKLRWKAPVTARGLGGVAASGRCVIISDRDLPDFADAYRCHDAETGKLVWSFQHPAPGKLDYGNTPRATPVVVGDRVYLYGAFGHLHCLSLADGALVWQKDLKAEFGPPGRDLPWGLCGTPLVTDGKVILAPGSAEAALAALDSATGALVWKSPGDPPGYGSFIVATLGGVRQIVGHDAETLGGWDLAAGKRLWRVKPLRSSDYNVPTPMVWNGHLAISTENNGTRLFRFRPGGQIEPTPLAQAKELAPDTHSPAVSGDRLFGVCHGLHAYDLKANLAKLWTLEDDAFSEYASLIACGSRLLILSQDGELLLVETAGVQPRILSRLRPMEGEKDLYSHPALLGKRLFIRGNDALYAFDLAE